MNELRNKRNNVYALFLYISESEYVYIKRMHIVDVHDYHIEKDDHILLLYAMTRSKNIIKKYISERNIPEHRYVILSIDITNNIHNLAYADISSQYTHISPTGDPYQEWFLYTKGEYLFINSSDEHKALLGLLYPKSQLSIKPLYLYVPFIIYGLRDYNILNVIHYDEFMEQVFNDTIKEHYNYCSILKLIFYYYY